MKLEEFVKKYDKQNQYHVLVESYKQIESAWNAEVNLKHSSKNELNNIIISGMGGSAISGDLLKCFLKDEISIPIIVNRDYSIPSYADEKSLVIISSYSGNTEESISSFQDTLKKNCIIIAVSTGGKIIELVKKNNIPWIKLQKGLQPRYALGTSFFTLLKLLQTLKLIPEQDTVVKEIISLWKEKGVEYSKEKNIALAHAQELIGFIPLIYTSSFLEPVGYRMKCQFNENSKLHAYNNVIPELNHNEIIGWESFFDKQFNLKLISILDEDYYPQIKKRFEITSELIQAASADIISLKSNEEYLKVRIMDLIYLGDWISYYLSILRGFDPSEIENINTLKHRLA
jgi:glucose/mannose-6-phosphate isomerase